MIRFLSAVSISEMLAMNAALPVSRKPMYREKRACRSPSHPAGICSSFRRERA
jgi:hypothetical protein